MKKNTIIAGAVGAVIVAAGIGGAALIPKDEVKLDKAQTIEWVKPTTDAGWALDTEAEGFDARTTEQLGDMKVAHTEKLSRLEANFQEYTDCSECIKYRVKKDHPDWSQQDIDDEFTNQYDHKLWEIEKIKQSIERMDEELRLRSSGYLVPNKKDDGTPQTASKLKNLPDARIRKIVE